MPLKISPKAIELNPDYTEAYNNRGMAYYKKGEVDCALNDLNRAIQLNPDSPQVHKNRALVHYSAGKHHWALADINCAIQLEPNDLKFLKIRDTIARNIS